MSRILLTLFFLSLNCFGFSPVEAQDEPLRLHPENSRYLQWRGRPTILITSAEHYGALLNLDFDFRTYFAELEQNGLNHTRIFAGTYRELAGSHGIADNTLAPADNRFLAPWKRSDQPGYFVGGNKFDLTAFNPDYFQRLKELMTEARNRGIVVEFNFFCPLYGDGEWNGSPFNPANNVNGLGNCPREEILSLKHPQLLAVQEEFVKAVVRELNSFDNLYYEICNEPYIRKVPDDWQRKIVRTIRDAESTLPHRHLISLNIANGAAKVELAPEGVSILNFHYCVPPDVVAMNEHLNLLIGENETGFRGKHDFLYRSEGWDFLLAGGGLYNSLDYSFTVTHPAGDLREYKAPGGGSRELRQQLGILKKFLEGFDFIRMRPDSKVVSRISDNLSWKALSRPGEDYALYLHVPVKKNPKKIEDVLRTGIRATLTLQLPAGKFREEWIDTLTGTVLKTEEWEQTGSERELATPQFDNDVALRLRRISDVAPQ